MRANLLFAAAVTSFACGPGAAKPPPTPPGPVDIKEPPPEPGDAPITAEAFVAAVHPMCFWSNEDKIPLAGCDRVDDDKPVTGKIEVTGTEKSFTPDSGEWGTGSSYEVLGIFPTGVLVRSSYNSGGTGYFDALGLYDLDPTHLIHKRTIHAGDRCNGGISDALVSGNTLSYQAAITPYDIIKLGGKDLMNDNSYNLPLAATSCAGKLAFEFDLVTGKSRRTGVEIDTDDSETCFGRTVIAHAKKWSGSPGDPEIAALAAAFAADCKGQD